MQKTNTLPAYIYMKNLKRDIQFGKSVLVLTGI